MSPLPHAVTKTMEEHSGTLVKTIYCNKWSTVRPGSEGFARKTLHESDRQRAFGRVKVRQDDFRAVLDQAHGGCGDGGGKHFASQQRCV